jgi:hypothetical protein
MRYCIIYFCLCSLAHCWILLLLNFVLYFQMGICNFWFFCRFIELILYPFSEHFYFVWIYIISYCSRTTFLIAFILFWVCFTVVCPMCDSWFVFECTLVFEYLPIGQTYVFFSKSKVNLSFPNASLFCIFFRRNICRIILSEWNFLIHLRDFIFFFIKINTLL